MEGQGRAKKKIIIGLTGSFGSGKTTVARIFKSYGAKVIDADKLAHQCIRRGSPGYKKIIAIFGRGILGRAKLIDRKKLARAVFGNKALLKRLNRIIHPQVIGAIRGELKKIRAGMIILDAPLLIESGMQKGVDKTIVVTINRKVQMNRIKKKAPLSNSEILKRIGSQMPLEEKKAFADFVIDNSGPLTETRKQAVQIWRLVWKS